MNDGRERRTIIYTGQVQGVGFRNRTSHIARRFPIVGYVRNLPNGSVEIVVEGASADIGAYMRTVDGAWKVISRIRPARRAPRRANLTNSTFLLSDRLQEGLGTDEIRHYRVGHLSGRHSSTSFLVDRLYGHGRDLPLSFLSALQHVWRRHQDGE